MNFIVYTFSHLVTFVIHVNVHFDNFIKKKKILVSYTHILHGEKKLLHLLNIPVTSCR